VTLFTQTVNTLTTSTVYYNTSGLLELLTLNGNYVTLGMIVTDLGTGLTSPSNAVVVTNDVSSGTYRGEVIGYNSITGRRFVYDANGVQQ